jgi:catechol 2,3-dioxygenase-like lactoylglutathione lyase family enzyme
MPMAQDAAGRAKEALSKERRVTMKLDHIILPVNDKARSLAFYTKVLGFTEEPYALLRVTPDFVIQVMQRGTEGGEHLAFSMSKSEFDRTLARVKEAAIPFGDNFDRVGNMKGPGRASGSSPRGSSIYFLDPDKHMLEIMHYEAPEGSSRA